MLDSFCGGDGWPEGWTVTGDLPRERADRTMAGKGGSFDGTDEVCLHAIKFRGPRGRMGLVYAIRPIRSDPFAIVFRLATCLDPVGAMLDGAYSGKSPGFRVLLQDASGIELACIETLGRVGELALNGQPTGFVLPMLTWQSFCLVLEPTAQRVTLHVADSQADAPVAVGRLIGTARSTLPPSEVAFMVPDDEEGYAALWVDAFALRAGIEPTMPTGTGAHRVPVGEVLPAAGHRLSPVAPGGVTAGGHIGARLDLAIHKNMLALDIEGDFLAPHGVSGSRGAKDGEALEQGIFVGAGSLLDALAAMAFYSGDQAVREANVRLAARLTDLQHANGYLGVYPETAERCPLFTEFCLHDAVYLILGFVRDYQLHGRKTSLAAARKLADYIMDNWQRRPAAPVYTPLGINEAFMALYRVEADPRLLDFLKRERCGKQWTIQNASLLDWDQAVWKGGHGDRNGPQGGESAARHAIVHVYRLFERCMAQLTLYGLQPDDRLTVMPRRIIELLRDPERTGMLITGAAGSEEGWEDTQLCTGKVGETCVSVYGIWLMDALIRHTGDLRHGDVMERMIYNALFCAQEPAGRKLRYFSPPSGKREYYHRDTYCCPNNFRRGIVGLPEHIYYTHAGGIVVNLYETSEVELALETDVSVKLRQTTEYPADETVTLGFVGVAGDAEFGVTLRLPGWCRAPEVKVNGQRTAADMHRSWQVGDRIDVYLPMPWRFVKGRRTQAGRAAVMRGPLVYCLSRELNALPDDMVLRDITLDTSSIATAGRDDRGVLDKPLCRVRAWSPGSDIGVEPDLDLMLHEFPEPSGEEVYFKLSDAAVALDDELF